MLPIQISSSPEIEIIGFPLTFRFVCVVAEHPVVSSTNVNVAVPGDTPVTNPILSTVATAESLLIHVPPEEGLRFVVVPIQTVDGPV